MHPARTREHKDDAKKSMLARTPFFFANQHVHNFISIYTVTTNLLTIDILRRVELNTGGHSNITPVFSGAQISNMK
jgi:hypothetical protein